MKHLPLYIAVIAILVLIITNAETAAAYATDAAAMCMYMIVPALFPFFVCSGLLIYSGFCEKLAFLFRFCMKPLFNVSPSGASAFILGIISGYPLGAVTAGELFQNGYLTKTEAQRLLAFCNNSGPLFILGSVGAAMYSGIRFGAVLYIIHILAAVTVGIIFRFYHRHDYTAPKTIMTSPDRSAGEIFSIALQNAVSTMLTVCGAVVFFSMASRLVIDLSGADGMVYGVLTGICEFVTGSAFIADLKTSIAYKLIMSAFVIGFAGISVHMQVMAVIAKYRLSLLPYIVGKLLHGLISALYAVIYLHFFPLAFDVFSPAIQIMPSISGGFAVSAVFEFTAAALLALFGFSLMQAKNRLRGRNAEYK